LLEWKKKLLGQELWLVEFVQLAELPSQAWMPLVETQLDHI
jgi:hypothetical protein